METNPNLTLKLIEFLIKQSKILISYEFTLSV
jgi:hypothetical protein